MSHARRSCWACVVAIRLLAGGAARGEPPAPGDGELDAELRRFTEASQEFRGTVDRIVREEFRRRRRTIEQRYRERLSETERQERRARANAIAAMEAFLARYPDHPRATPDALYRLADLYAEQEGEAFLEAVEAAEASAQPAPPSPDHTRSVALLRRLVAGHPDYRYLDGALYQLGYSEDAMGHAAEARAAWLALVCPTGAPPYAGCAPLRPGSRHLGETWLRLGEQHFDLNQLAAAAAAYQHVLDGSTRESPWFDKALYKLAWTLYRADRMAEAATRFDELIALSGQGSAGGSDLRQEALQYLAICFAEPESDGRVRGGAGLARIDAFYAGRAPSHARDVYEQLGDVLFDQSDYPRAVEVYRAILARWPLHARNPRVQDRVILALDRARDPAALQEREVAVTRFDPHGPWSDANRGDDEAQAAARALRERNAARGAIEHHHRAQQLRAQAEAQADPVLARRATIEYELAAVAYRALLADFPASRDADEHRFLLGEALYYGGHLAEAARQYDDVRDRLVDDAPNREAAAFLAVKARERLLDLEVAAGRLPRTPLPSVDAARKEPVVRRELPPLVAELQAACDAYLHLLPRGQHAVALEYQSAEIDFRYARFAEARQRLAAFISRRCHQRDNLALVAEEALLTTLAIEKDMPAIRDWVQRLDGMACGVGNAREEARRRRAQLGADVRFLDAEARFAAGDHAAASASFLAIADEASPPTVRDHRAEAFFNAGLSQVKLHRSLVAVRIFERMAAELPDSPLVDEAIFQAAEAHQRLMNHAAALSLYLRLAEDPRLSGSKLRAAAMEQASRLLEYQQRYAEAARLATRLARRPNTSPPAAAEALLRAAALHRRAGDVAQAVHLLRETLATGADGPASGLGLRARRELADALDEAHDGRAALVLHREIAARAASVAPASAEADQVAASLFRLAEERLDGLAHRTISDGDDHLRSRQRFESELLSLDGAYAQVLAQKRAAWTLAAFYRQGHLRQLYAAALARLVTAPCPAAVRHRFGDDGCQLYADRLQQQLGPEIARLEKEAVDRYDVLLDQAARLRVATPWTAEARRQAQALDPIHHLLLHDERVALTLDP